MSDKMKLRVVGLCILAAFPLFGGGQSMLGGDLHQLGLFLCLSNSIAVMTVGVLMREVISTTAPRTGNTYLVARITEGVLLGFSALGMQLSLPITSDGLYQLGMIALGLGSLPMCYWLIRSKLVSPMLGALGFAGYLCLIAAMIAAANGLETASMALLLPGAVFEVMFGFILALSVGIFAPEPV